MRTPHFLWTALSALLIFASSARADATIGDGEALALELSGELLAPPELTATIDEHLSVIRDAEPFLTVVQPWLDWTAGDLWIRLTGSAFDEFLAGTYTGLDALNETYGPAEVTYFSDQFNDLVLDFEANYNPELLGAIYATASGVVDVEPNFLGGDGPDITAEALGTYLFRYGWYDCPAGCSFSHFWRYEISANGDAILLDEYGDALTGVGAPEIGNATDFQLNAVHPNPLTSSSRISYSLSRLATVSLDVIDVSGRHVRTLQVGSRPAGSHEVWWDGSSDHGEQVAAGTYFVALRADPAAPVIRKVTILR